MTTTTEKTTFDRISDQETIKTRRKHSLSCGHPLHSSPHSAKSKFYAENGKITYQKARLLAFVVGTGRTLRYIVVQVHLLVFKPTSCVQYNYVIYKHRSGWQHERVIIRRIKVARNSKDSPSSETQGQSVGSIKCSW